MVSTQSWTNDLLLVWKQKFSLWYLVLTKLPSPPKLKEIDANVHENFASMYSLDEQSASRKTQIKPVLPDHDSQLQDT